MPGEPDYWEAPAAEPLDAQESFTASEDEDDEDVEQEPSGHTTTSGRTGDPSQQRSLDCTSSDPTTDLFPAEDGALPGHTLSAVPPDHARDSRDDLVVLLSAPSDKAQSLRASSDVEASNAEAIAVEDGDRAPSVNGTTSAVPEDSALGEARPSSAVEDGHRAPSVNGTTFAVPEDSALGVERPSSAVERDPSGAVPARGARRRTRNAWHRRSQSYDQVINGRLDLHQMFVGAPAVVPHDGSYTDAHGAESPSGLPRRVESEHERWPISDAEDPDSRDSAGASRSRRRAGPNRRRLVHTRSLTLDFRGIGPYRGELKGNAAPPTSGRTRTESVTGGGDAVGAPWPRSGQTRRTEVARCAPHFWMDHTRAQDVGDAVMRFNDKPQAGIRHLRERSLLEEAPPPGEGADKAGGVDESDAQAISVFLHNAKGLSKRQIGQFLGEPTEQSRQVLKFYTQTFDFEAMNIVEALRDFLTPFRLPGEAQKIDRIMNAFSAHFHQTNPQTFSCEDTAYVLAFSLIMLNTDQHSTHVTRKMTETEFIRNNRGIDQGHDIAEHILSAAYHDIRMKEIKTTTEFDELSRHELMSWLRQGSVFIKYTHGRVGAFKSPHHEIKLWVEDDRLCYRNMTKRSRAEKKIPLQSITEVIVGANSMVFRRHGVKRIKDPAKDVYFSLVLNSRTLDLQAGTPELADFWTRYFKEVVERSRLEATARRLAMSAQPREQFLETAAKQWESEILPSWDEQRNATPTRLLWWEGIPTSVRAKVWLCVLGVDEAAAGGYAAAMGAVAHVAPSGTREGDAVTYAKHWLGEQYGEDSVLPELYSLFGKEASPMRQDAVQMLAALHLSTAGSRPVTDLAPCAPLIAGMLLLHLGRPLAYAALCVLVAHHVCGAVDDEGSAWRNKGFAAVVEHELPAMHHVFTALDVEPRAYFVRWLLSMFVPLLPIETASRLWDCYMRDGEIFLWRAAVELLRKRSSLILAEEIASDAGKLLEVLNSPVDDLSEKELFKSMHDHEASVADWMPLLQQKLPLPDQCWDLYANSYDADGSHSGMGDGDGDDDNGEADEENGVEPSAFPEAHATNGPEL